MAAIRAGQAPLGDPQLDVHLLEVIEAATRSAAEGRTVEVESRFAPLEGLRLEAAAGGHVHDRTRPAAEQ